MSDLAVMSHDDLRDSPEQALETAVLRAEYETALAELRRESQDHPQALAVQNPYTGEMIATEADYELYLRQHALSLVYAGRYLKAREESEQRLALRDAEHQCRELELSNRIGSLETANGRYKKRGIFSLATAAVLAATLLLTVFLVLPREGAARFSAGVSAGYAEGYGAGETAGYSDGSAAGYAEGETAGYAAGRSDGSSEGYASGESAGYSTGYEAGLAAGYDTGYEAGESAGYTTGYEAGETAGYSTGYSEGQVSAAVAASARTHPEITESTVVYVSRSGVIHLLHDCSGMVHYTEMTYADAVAAGYRACSKCF